MNVRQYKGHTPQPTPHAYTAHDDAPHNRSITYQRRTNNFEVLLEATYYCSAASRLCRVREIAHPQRCSTIKKYSILHQSIQYPARTAYATNCVALLLLFNILYRWTMQLQSA